MVVKFMVAFSSSGYTLDSSRLLSKKVLPLINFVLNVLNNSVSQKCLQGFVSVHSAPFLKEQMICKTFSTQGSQERKAWVLQPRPRWSFTFLSYSCVNESREL